METVKAMDVESEGFPYLRQKISKISEAKMKGGVFWVQKLHNY